MADTRCRCWTFIAYPDSAPDNWRTVLDGYHIEWAESPLHEFDVNPDGEIKKPHWHILVCFTNVKSYEQVREICNSINATIPQKCHNSKSLIRYFAHLDNPEKHQYDASKIVAHGGLDLNDLLKPSFAQRYETIGEMINFCRQQGLTEFYEFMNYCVDERPYDWLPIACESGVALVLNSYLRSFKFGGRE